MEFQLFFVSILLLITEVGSNLHVHVSLDGFDNSQCGSPSTPCKTIENAITVAPSKASIVINGGEKEQMVYELTNSILITKTLHIVGRYYRKLPIVKPARNTTLKQAFIIDSVLEDEFCIEKMIFHNISMIYVRSQNHRSDYLSVRILDVMAFNVEEERTLLDSDEKIDLLQLNIASTIIQGFSSIFHAEYCQGLIVTVVNVKATGVTIEDENGWSAVMIRKNSVKQYVKVTLLSSFFKSFSSVLHLVLPQVKTISSQNQVLIRDCTFLSNWFDVDKTAVYNATLFISGNTDITIENSSFIGNTGKQAGVLYLKKIGGKVVVSDSNFQNNTAKWQGGAIYFVDCKHAVVLENCLFENNFVADENNGNGGAIDNHGSLTIKDCMFINNTAQVFGGTIKHAQFLSDLNKHGRLILKNSIIIGASKGESLAGDLIYSNSDIVSDNVTLHLVNPQAKSPQGVSHNNGQMKVISNFSFTCPVNHKIYIKKGITDNNDTSLSFTSLNYICSPCPDNFYSINKSFTDQSQNSTRNVTCYKVPTGGNVFNGILTCQDEFYGYPTNDQVSFIQCPTSYCCSKQDQPCHGFGTCNYHRTGILCGSCIKGYSINFVSNMCVRNINCNSDTFWSLFCFIAMLQFICVLYMKPIIKYLKSMMEMIYSKCLQYGRHDEFTENYKKKRWSNKNDCFVSGFIKILFSFYQIEYAIRIRTSLKRSHEYTLGFGNIVSSIFTLDIASAKYWFLFCPFPDMNIIEKLAVKTSYNFLLFFIISCLFLLTYIVQKLKKENYSISKTQYNSIEQIDLPIDSPKTFQHQLICCFVHLSLASYATLTLTALQLIHCIPINGESRLYIYGDFVCFTIWQYMIMFIVIFCLVPFPFTIYLNVYCLRNCIITVEQFVSGLIFPPIVLIYYFSYKCTHKKPQLTKVNIVIHKHIVVIFEEPFRVTYWESVLLLRCSAIILICVLVPNTLLRSYSIHVPLMLYIVHHIYVRPYKSNLLNWLETFSLLLLSFMGVINLYWSYIHISNVAETEFLRLLGRIFVIIENIILTLPILLMIFIILAYIGWCIAYVCVRKCSKHQFN